MRPTPQPPPILRDRLIQLLERMKSRRIVVIGDVMLDRYLIGDTERLSPEAPVPVVAIRETRSALGGAANVAANHPRFAGVRKSTARGKRARITSSSHPASNIALSTNNPQASNDQGANSQAVRG